MSKLSKGLTITAVSAALVGSIGFAYAQSTSTEPGSALNPNTNATGTVSTPSTSGMSTPTDNRVAPMNTQNNTSTNLERGTGANANDGLNNLPAPAAGMETAAPAPVITPERPPRADRN